LPDPTQFGRYKVTGKLGAGAMGEVYAAVDEVLGRQVAIKALRPQRSGLGARIVDERFRLEARAIATLTHPGIVQVFDIDLAADPPFLVMERVAGPSLKERLDQHGKLPVDEVRALGIQIARALAAAHTAGIVHRDVKPANILAAGTGAWKLADFGVAHVPDSSLTMTGQFIGSPAYAAPEALIAGKTLPASDVFGLGATLYLAATGTWPRGDGPTSAPLAPIPPVRELAPTLEPTLASLIDRAVALEHEHRPSAAELASALEVRTATDTVFVPDAAPKRTRSRKPLVAVIVGASLFGGAIVIGTTLTHRSKPAVVVHDAALRVSDAATSDAAIDAPDDALDADADIDARPPIEDPPPGSLRIITPTPMPADPQAMKEWRKLVDKLYDHKLEDARARLDAWETRWGATEETRSLHRQLDAMPRSDD